MHTETLPPSPGLTLRISQQCSLIIATRTHTQTHTHTHTFATSKQSQNMCGALSLPLISLCRNHANTHMPPVQGTNSRDARAHHHAHTNTHTQHRCRRCRARTQETHAHTITHTRTRTHNTDAAGAGHELKQRQSAGGDIPPDAGNLKRC